MKILMVLESEFPPDTRVENEIGSLIADGYKIVLACSSPQCANEQITWNNTKIIKKKMPKIIYKFSVATLKFPFYFLFWKKYLTSILKETKFDAIHIHDLPLSKVAEELAQKFKIKFVLDLHENWPAAMEIAVHTNTILGKIMSSNKQWRRYEKNMTIKADKIITVVEEMKTRIIALENISEKIYVLPNTIRLTDQKLDSALIDSDKFILLYVGGINVHRGLQIVLQAIRLIREIIPSFVFEIVGDGSYKKELQKFVDHNKLNSYVKFLGWKDYNRMMLIISQADVAIIPHLRSEQTDNSSPNKLFQYMFKKKPIIASDCTSIKRILNETKAGITYEADNYTDLAESIIYFYKDSKKRKEMSQAGYEAVVSNYNWGKTSKSLIKLYQDLEKQK